MDSGRNTREKQTMKLTRRILMIAAGAVLFGFAAQAQADVKFGVAAEPYPPFESKDASGNWVGWEMDLMRAICEQMKEKCLDFIDTLWTNEGAFHGHWGDEHLDCEYTFYGLLALGHLSF